jgi:hypothetical protein
VDDPEGALETVVAEVGIELGELGGGEHSLVDDGAGAEAWEGELVADRELDPPARDEQLALEGELVVQLVARRDHQLADERRCAASAVAGLALVDGDVAPAEREDALAHDRLLDQALELVAPDLVLGEEAHRNRHPVGLGQLVLGEPELPRPVADELVGDLDQDAGAVAGARVRSLGSTVLEVVESRERPLDHLVDRHVVEPRHAGDAAGVMLRGGVVEARVGPVGCAGSGHGWVRRGAGRRDQTLKRT